MRRINATHASDQQRPQSPTPRISSNGVASPRRAASVERRRSLVTDTKAQSSSLNAGSASRRLWPSSNGAFSSLQAISGASLLDGRPLKDRPEAKRKVEAGDQTLRPAANGVHRSVDFSERRKTPERKGTIPERKGTPARRRLSTDQAENARPTEAVQPKADVQRPQGSGAEGKRGFLSRSLDLGTPKGSNPSRTAASLLMQASSPNITSPRSFRSSSTTRVVPSSSINEATPRRMSPDTRGIRRDTGIIGQRKLDTAQNFPSKSEVHMAGAVSAKSKSIERTKTMPSPTEPGLADNKLTRSSWASSPVRGRSPNLTAGAQAYPSSFAQSKIVRAPSPLRGLQSPTRSRVPSSPLLSSVSLNFHPKSPLGIASFSVEGAKGKRTTVSQMEEALLLKVLHNRWMQWRFVNARADAILNIQKAFVEKSLFNVWIKTSNLRASVETQRVKLQEARESIKLDSILSSYAIHLEAASAVQDEHLVAVSGVTEALKSATLIIPVTGVARADLRGIKETVGYAAELINAMGVIVRALVPKVARLDNLASELAKGAAQEMTLLAECGNLLAKVATLETEEYSLRAHFMQLQHGKLHCQQAA
ncbi:hypothetical protein O6H91_03G060300 [Diphasiastrum complanatum]|uniref:Uncharacterized protein n=3 Tax=Diphasiastrum complanatum TaxID=34168 RepID=A0ACC2E6Y4_DIPCM|nr:hypothetical protein O6H91_03G060300 [Diphasiastrum complanatum]KAJ7562238.1 hypothetical protein O6H91_03G060300 [Diphasiastrum complanatum]KAJ7562239.1 hypothetical protein O6H91_03G060300 [Diphasiastrum complanatum]